MKLGTKIIIGFFCISILLAAIGFITNQFTDQIREEQFQFVSDGSDVVILTGEMERSLYQSLIFLNAIRESRQINDALNNVQNLPAVSELRLKYNRELEKFDLAFIQLKEIFTRNSTLPETLKDVEEKTTIYRSLSREWLELDPDSFDQANLMFVNSVEPYFRNNIIPDITKLRNYTLEIEKQKIGKLNDSLRKASLANYWATLISVIFAVTLAIYIYRSIANPLLTLNEAASRIGKGDLNQKIPVTSKDEIGELAATINQMATNLKEKTVSKDFLDNIIGSIQESVFVTDSNGKFVITNSAASRMLGYSREEFGELRIEDLMIQEQKNTLRHMEGKSNASFEHDLIDRNGKKIPVLFSRAALNDDDGELIGTVVVASDISDRKQKEEQIRNSLREKEVLLAEIHHRVKNNLAVISGLMQLQRFSAENEVVEKALSDSQMRIQSIALVHEKLYQSESLAFIEYDQYVEDLLQAISDMQNAAGKNIKIESDTEPISLSINQAIPSSLLMNELIVNAYKHAFDDKAEGQIKVSLKEREGDIIIVVEDNGKGIDKETFFESDSLGVSLIQTLCDQLSGTFSFDAPTHGDEGSMFVLQFKKAK